MAELLIQAFPLRLPPGSFDACMCVDRVEQRPLPEAKSARGAADDIRSSSSMALSADGR